MTIRLRSHIAPICLPALILSVSAVLIGGLAWGPIVAALVAIVVLPAMVLAWALSLAVLWKRERRSRPRAWLTALVLYAAAIFIVILLWHAFGPSQIM